MRVKNFLTHVLIKLFGYKIGDRSISLPFGHMLPIYQKQFVKYDKVLPALIAEKSNKITFIDIGANVGDTLYSLIESRNKISEYHAVDGSRLFYKYLKKNIKKTKYEDWIYSYNQIVTTTTDKVVIENNYGTGKMGSLEASSQLVENLTLNEFIHKNIRDKSNVFLKVDVDGADLDVLLSGIDFILDYLPELFFECDYEPNAFVLYFDFLVRLTDIGYQLDFYDNFGQLIVKNARIDVVQCLFEYRDQQFSNENRTVYYFDVHAYK